jgi:hypothetical protein
MIVAPPEKFRQNPKSVRAAMNAKCFDCIYDSANGPPGTWRRQIAACTIQTCALWRFRAKSSSVKFNDQGEHYESMAEN